MNDNVYNPSKEEILKILQSDDLSNIMYLFKRHPENLKSLLNNNEVDKQIINNLLSSFYQDKKNYDEFLNLLLKEFTKIPIEYYRIFRNHGISTFNIPKDVLISSINSYSNEELYDAMLNFDFEKSKDLIMAMLNKEDISQNNIEYIAYLCVWNSEIIAFINEKFGMSKETVERVVNYNTRNINAKTNHPFTSSVEGEDPYSDEFHYYSDDFVPYLKDLFVSASLEIDQSQEEKIYLSAIDLISREFYEIAYFKKVEKIHEKYATILNSFMSNDLNDLQKRIVKYYLITLITAYEKDMEYFKHFNDEKEIIKYQNMALNMLSRLPELDEFETEKLSSRNSQNINNYLESHKPKSHSR